MLKDLFGLFMIDHRDLDKNMWMLTQRSKGGVTMERLENMPFWRYEDMVSIANELADEEKKEKEKQDEQQKSSNTSYNPGTYLNKMSSMANKFK